MSETLSVNPNNLKTHKESPALVAKASKGNSKFWQGRILTDGKSFYLSAEFWQQNSDGSDSLHQTSAPVKVEPKNVGRANETTAQEQAEAELASLIKKQQDKGYDIPGAKVTRRYLLPMLAHKMKEKEHTLRYPVFTQPKFDGLRAVFHSDMGFWSRLGKPFVPDVTKHLAFDTQGYTLDGELILDSSYGGFQDTISAVKKYNAESAPFIQYHVFDLVDETMPFAERIKVLERLLKGAPKGVILVPSKQAQTKADVLTHHHDYVNQGHEGTIIRSAHGLYKVGHRSSDLLKHKDFDDAEFPVVRVESGVGKDEGTALFVLRATNGSEFKARLKGTLGVRRKHYTDRAKLTGKQVTVRYQGLSDEGIPRFPVALAVRDYE